MKKMIMLTIYFVTVCSAISICLCIKVRQVGSDNILNKENFQSYSLHSSYPSYVVKDYNGNIAVYESGRSEPFRVTETLVKDLPYADKELLEFGIEANNIEELNIILEDYCS